MDRGKQVILVVFKTVTIFSMLLSTQYTGKKRVESGSFDFIKDFFKILCKITVELNIKIHLYVISGNDSKIILRVFFL